MQMNEGCKIYDVTGNAGAALGKETTLQVGDRFNAVGTSDGYATHIFITARRAK